MSPERWALIAAELAKGPNMRQVSLRLGIEYKTIWLVAKRLEANRGQAA